jgi:hypothetical protein
MSDTVQVGVLRTQFGFAFRVVLPSGERSTLRPTFARRRVLHFAGGFGTHRTCHARFNR